MKAGWWIDIAFPSKRMRRQVELRMDSVDCCDGEERG